MTNGGRPGSRADGQSGTAGHSGSRAIGQSGIAGQWGRRSLVLCLTPLLLGTGASAQEKVGTIVVAHGGSEAWNRLVKDVAAQARTGGPVEVSFLMGAGAKADPFQRIIGRLEQAGVKRIVVVPLLVSSHSGHYEQIRYLAGQTRELDETMMHHLHMGGLEPVTSKVPIAVARAIDDSPDVARILAERARSLVSAPQGRALFLVGHGPNSPAEHAIWMKNLRTLAVVVKQQTGFADVRVGVIQDDAPATVRAEAVLRVREIIELQHEATRQSVAVVPVLISKGSLSQEKLPNDLRGMPIVYDGEALLPHAGLARWIEARVRESAGAKVSARNR
jgi:sirohydrochlorin cobaltochelatase